VGTLLWLHSTCCVRHRDAVRLLRGAVALPASRAVLGDHRRALDAFNRYVLAAVLLVLAGGVVAALLHRPPAEHAEPLATAE